MDLRLFKAFYHVLRQRSPKGEKHRKAAGLESETCATSYYTGFTSPSSCPTTGPGSGSGNNGNVMGWYHWDGDPWGPGSGVLNTTNYVYDALNRLQRTYVTGHYSQTYNYDRYGNMACAPGSDYCNTTITFDVQTNHINTSGYTYDAAGNLTQDGTGYGTHTFQWDAEGRLKSVDSGATASFVYNALGQRVEKQVGSAYTETLYDAFGSVSGYHNRTAWVQDFIPLGSRIFAKYQDGVTYYLHGNPLGSTQVVMRADNSYAQAQNFFSFGGLRWSGGGTQDVRFASMQERDLETTTWQDPLDLTPNRTYTSGLGRWLSPDPVAGNILSPQSLNRYGYVVNSPTALTDPLGLQGCPGWAGMWQCVEPHHAFSGPPGVRLGFLWGGSGWVFSAVIAGWTWTLNKIPGGAVTTKLYFGGDKIVSGETDYPESYEMELVPAEGGETPSGSNSSLSRAWATVDNAYGEALSTAGQFFRGRPRGQTFGACVAQNVNITLTQSINNSNNSIWRAVGSGTSGMAGLALTHLTISGVETSAYLAMVVGAYSGIFTNPVTLAYTGVGVGSAAATVGGIGIGVMLGSAANCASVRVGP